MIIFLTVVQINRTSGNFYPGVFPLHNATHISNAIHIPFMNTAQLITDVDIVFIDHTADKFNTFSSSCTITYDVRLHTPPCSTVVHFLSRLSLFFDIILHSTLSNHCLLGLPLFLFPCTFITSSSFLRSVPLLSSHAHTTSTSFPGLSLRFIDHTAEDFNTL